MSFASDVKRELSTVESFDCCTLAQSYGLVLFGRNFGASGLSLLTENETVADIYKNAVYELSGVCPQVDISDSGNFKIHIESHEITGKILEKTGYANAAPKRRINFDIIKNTCCRASFLRGAFLVAGTLTDPEKEYHFEFTVPTKGLCDDLVTLLCDMEMPPKTTVRAGAHIVYFKSSSEIEDMLSLMGATENAMQIMGAKMYKDIRNNVNRKVNFENANMQRSIAAAKKQFDAIEFIRKTAGFDSLPDDLKELAVLRYEHREESNAELAQMLSEPLTRSGLNHRFRRLLAIADEMKNKAEKKE